MGVEMVRGCWSWCREGLEGVEVGVERGGLEGVELGVEGLKWV